MPRSAPRAVPRRPDRIPSRRSRRPLAAVVPVIAAAVALLCGCTAAGAGPAADQSPAPSTSTGAAPPVLRLVVTGGYVQDGSTNPGVNWVSPFEVESGCQVELTNAPDDADAVHDIVAHGSLYDGVLASPTTAGELIAARAVAPLRTARIRGYATLDPRLRSAPVERSGGTVYGVPYLWDTYTIGYDTGQVKPPPQGWGALFASAPRYAGKIMLPDSPATLALAALYLRSVRPALRISDPFELDAAQLAAAVSVLRRVRSSVGTFWSTDGTVVGQLGDTQDVLGAVMAHQIGEMARAGLGVANVGTPTASSGAVPTVGYVESWLVSARAPDPACMYKWLSWTTSSYVQQRAAEWSGLAPAGPSGCTGPVAAICRLYHEGSLAAATNIVFDHLPVSRCGDGRTGCATYTRWVSAWRSVVPGYVAGSGV